MIRKYLIYIFLLASAAGFSNCGINSIPTYDEEVKAQWSQVLNQYKRRADLIPGLVSTVKGYAAHEKNVLIEVTNARSRVAQMNIPSDILTNKAAFSAFQQNQAGLSSALARLMVVVEKYPDLKANQNFLALQSQLEGTENRIAVARMDYINSVKKYNTEIRTYPGKWWKAMLYPDAVLKENFTVEDEKTIQTAPEIKF
jgi:LemA protein